MTVWRINGLTDGWLSASIPELAACEPESLGVLPINSLFMCKSKMSATFLTLTTRCCPPHYILMSAGCTDSSWKQSFHLEADSLSLPSGPFL